MPRVGQIRPRQQWQMQNAPQTQFVPVEPQAAIQQVPEPCKLSIAMKRQFKAFEKTLKPKDYDKIQQAVKEEEEKPTFIFD